MITARITKQGTHFQNVTKRSTTAIDVRPLRDGRQLVTVESWRNDSELKPYYAHRTITRDRESAMGWVRTMLPLPIAL